MDKILTAQGRMTGVLRHIFVRYKPYGMTIRHFDGIITSAGFSMKLDTKFKEYSLKIFWSAWTYSDTNYKPTKFYVRKYIINSYKPTILQYISLYLTTSLEFNMNYLCRISLLTVRQEVTGRFRHTVQNNC